MSILVHHCRTCGHMEPAHLVRDDTPPDRRRLYEPVDTSKIVLLKHCRCCGKSDTQRDIDPEPVVHETRTYPGLAPEPLQEPGSMWGHPSIRLCGCDNCHTAYATATGRA